MEKEGIRQKVAYEKMCDNSQIQIGVKFDPKQTKITVIFVNLKVLHRDARNSSNKMFYKNKTEYALIARCCMFCQEFC